MPKLIDTLLLLALPASGKSEVRRYLKELDVNECRDDFHMGPTLQLDDYPYVHLMRRVDEALRRIGHEGVYFKGADRSFQDPWDWGTLIELVNEDYDDLVMKRVVTAESAGEYILARLDAAAKRSGATVKIAGLDDEERAAVLETIELESRAQIDEKNANIPETLEGHTIVIEFARGGADGSSMPLAAPFGYAHSVATLSSQILNRSSILYVWVTPEESRRKNHERADPNDPGSILNHGVPDEVMYGDYGCDDMDYLEANTEKPGTITIEKDSEVFHLAIGRFDNRVDKTSFIRGDKVDWDPKDVRAVHLGLKAGLDKLI